MKFPHIILGSFLLVQSSWTSATVPGIDQLTPNSRWIQELNGQRVALLVHHASRTSHGMHLIDRMRALRVTLTALFAPEHGLRSDRDDSIEDERDSKTGLPVFAFSWKSKNPLPKMTADQLSLFDVLVIDLVDVGLRYFTYPGTVVCALQSAIGSGKRVILLDRPNPLGGSIVSGPTLKDHVGFNLFTQLAIPVRHGMTLGELAQFWISKSTLPAERFTIVPVREWNREQQWPQWNQEWIAPSPALASYEQLVLYSIFAPLEALELSVGRDQDPHLAFRRFGSPQITQRQVHQLVKHLNAAKLPGLRFTPVVWTPSRREFSGRECRGVKISVTERLEKLADKLYWSASWKILRILRSTLGDHIDWTRNHRRLALYLGSEALLNALIGSADDSQVLDQAAKESLEFEKIRSAFLTSKSSK